MGRHQPRGWGHRRRFVVAFVGLVAIAFLTMAVVALLYPNAS